MRFRWCIYFLMFFFVGCSQTDEEEHSVDKELAVSLRLSVDSKYVALWYGTADTVDVLSGQLNLVRSVDSSVVSVELEGNRLYLRALKPGATSIYCMADCTAPFMIHCCSYTLKGLWGEVASDNIKYRGKPVVVINDKEISTFVSSEIVRRTEATYNDARYVWKFDGNDSLKQYFKTTDFENSVPIKFLYKWDAEKQQLNIERNGNTDEFSCQILPPDDAMNNFLVLAITQDFTEEYAQRYPNLNVERVTLTRYLQSYDYQW